MEIYNIAERWLVTLYERSLCLKQFKAQLRYN